MKLTIPVYEPWITDLSKRYVVDVLESGYISSVGPMVGRFELAFAEFLGVDYAVTTNSGTSALHLALLSLGVGPGDEVIVPDFTMIATVNAVLYTGATPVLVDVEPGIWTIDPAQLEAAITSRTKAVLPVHIYGHSADMDPIIATARRHGMAVLEDAAEAHGARYRGRRCGALGDVSAFSFYGNKIITTGEGGIVATNDLRIAERVRSLRNLAHMPDQRFHHAELGFSFRMTSLQAALGLGQIECVEALLKRKREIAARYLGRLSRHRVLQLPVTRPWAEPVYWMFAVLIDSSCPLDRDQFCDVLREQGIETRNFFPSCASQPLVRSKLGPQAPFPVSEDIAARGCYLPSGLALSDAQIDRVCDVIDEVLS